jgi:hypothetical protein
VEAGGDEGVEVEKIEIPTDLPRPFLANREELLEGCLGGQVAFLVDVAQVHADVGHRGLEELRHQRLREPDGRAFEAHINLVGQITRRSESEIVGT